MRRTPCGESDSVITVPELMKLKEIGQFPDVCRQFLFEYEQQIKRDLKRIRVSGGRCNERLKVKTEGSKCLGYTGL